MSKSDYGDFHPLASDADWRNYFLADTESIYGDMKPDIFSSRPGTEIAPGEMRMRRAIAWDLGLDKAFYGHQASAAPSFGAIPLDDFPEDIQANLIKSGVMSHYYQRAYELGGGTPLSTLAAELAFAAQTLQAWIEATAKLDRRPLGIREDVLARFETAVSLAEMSDEDLAYLADILRSELSLFRSGRLNFYGQRDIPAPLRVARVAAAYRISQGFDAPPCHADGTADREVAGSDAAATTRPICFTDATDRAVYRWYRTERARQIGRFIASKDATPSRVRLLAAFENVKPAWAGAYGIDAMSTSPFAEIVEAQMALDLPGTEDGEKRFYQMVERAHIAIHSGDRP
ncbi:hypothetical protein [Luteibacter sp. CQ10]|uniref:hypothetical protein n=1 Tax=Luteibacter sp. CQ10 TaxID=2805821 RepID=UPI0034A444ED